MTHGNSNNNKKRINIIWVLIHRRITSLSTSAQRQRRGETAVQYHSLLMVIKDEGQTFFFGKETHLLSNCRTGGPQSRYARLGKEKKKHLLLQGFEPRFLRVQPAAEPT